MVLRVVVIGGDAAGGSAASGIKRKLGDAAEVVVLEQQRWTSYAACGIPYWIAGESQGPDGLVARTPEQHRANGLDVHTGTRATAIDLARSTVTAHPVADPDATTEYPYDQLVVATGAAALRPPIPGIGAAGVHPVHTLDDGVAALEDLAEGRQRAVVVGAGFIGVEMAEACRARGLETTVVEVASEPLTILDSDMGARVREAMVAGGVKMVLGEGVTEFRAGRDAAGRVAEVMTPSGSISADIVFLGMGARPRTELAKEAGLPLGARGGLITNARQQVLGHDNIWAAGDCVESVNRMTQQRQFVPLGTHANKQGRVAGVNIAGGRAAFAGILGTAITRFQGLEISRTGLSQSEAQAIGFDCRSATVDTLTHAGYYPGAEEMTVKMTGEVGTQRLLGAQIVGGRGSAKRIDTVAAALWADLRVGDLVDMDLSYAPPFSGAWDPVQVAARQLEGRL